MMTLLVALFVGVGYLVVHYSSASSCTLSPILVNSCRPLIGAAAHGNPGAPNDQVAQFNYLEKLVGQSMDVDRQYHAPLSDTGNSNATLPLDPNTKEGQAETQLADAGVILDINWDVTHTWSQALPVSQGGDPTINSQIDQAAANIKKLPHKIFLSPWHEANDHISAADNSSEQCNQVNTKDPNGTPAQFVAAWQNIYKHFKDDGVTNVVWVLNYAGYAPNSCWVPYMWPGNNEVDWVIVDSYAHNSGENWDQTAGDFYKNVLQADSTSARNFDSKPWGIGEFGCSAATPAKTYAYYNSITAAVKANSYPNYKMYLIFADTGNNAGSGCLTNYDPAAAGASFGPLDNQKEADINSMFAAMVGPISVPSSPPPTPPITPVDVAISEPAPGSTLSGVVQVKADTNIPASITIMLNNTTEKTCSAATTCIWTWNTTTQNNGGFVLKAVARAAGSSNQTLENVSVLNVISPPPTSPPISPPPVLTGLTGNYYDNMDLSGKPAVTKIVKTVNFNWCINFPWFHFHYCWSPAAGLGTTNYSIGWTGKVTAPATGVYTFTTRTDDGVRLFINGQLIINQWHLQPATSWSGNVTLVAGQPVPIEMDYYQHLGVASAKLMWQGPLMAKPVVIPTTALTSSQAVPIPIDTPIPTITPRPPVR